MTLDQALAELPPPPRPLKALAPSYLDPAEWRPGRGRAVVPPGWTALRRQVLLRDGGCVYCGHVPSNDRRDHLEVNHLNGYRDNQLQALETVCVLCHRVLHAGRSAAIYGSLLLFRTALVDQNTLIRLSWHLRLAHAMPDRPLMALLGLGDPASFRMDRAYLATLYGYVVEQYWLLERGPVGPG
ncbi:MAG TPA: hypothetical protein VHB98_14525 [Chloroflexota bacterium]|jgi:hypothetical protein|nr:hypothetical protein [Chloroflexota bacterium]